MWQSCTVGHEDQLRISLGQGLDSRPEIRIYTRLMHRAGASRLSSTEAKHQLSPSPELQATRGFLQDTGPGRAKDARNQIAWTRSESKQRHKRTRKRTALQAGSGWFDMACRALISSEAATPRRRSGKRRVNIMEDQSSRSPGDPCLLSGSRPNSPHWLPTYRNPRRTRTRKAGLPERS